MIPRYRLFCSGEIKVGVARMHKTPKIPSLIFYEFRKVFQKKHNTQFLTFY